MRRITRCTYFSIAVLAVSLACADAARALESAKADSLQKKRYSIVALPFTFYTPETKFAFGAGSVYTFRSSDTSLAGKPSSVGIALTYTQLNQILVASTPEIYLMKGQYYFNAFYGYYKFPNKFWGIGNDTPDGAEENYEQNDFESITDIQRRIRSGFYAGSRYQFQHMSPRKVSANGALAGGAIPGSRGGIASGLGIVVMYDSRNHTYQPSAGSRSQLSAVFFGAAAGSDFSFTLLTIDLRKYVSVFGSHVLAFQTYDGFIIGHAPFQMLNLLGGSYSMRGYYRGRYRDKNMITFQTEYRLPLFWRIGAVGFAGFGDVSNGIGKFRLDQFKYSLGVGFRFLFDKRERINARVDIGFGEGDNAGVYARVVEAF